MKKTNLVGLPSVIRLLASIATVAGLVVGGCTDTPLDLRPTIPASAKAATQGAGSTKGDGGSGSADGGDEAGVGSEGGLGADSGASATGGSGGASQNGGSAATGGTGGSAGGPQNLCGNSHVDAGEQCDDGNQLSGDGCSYNCQSACEVCERDTCPTLAMAGQQTFGLFAYTQAWSIQGDAKNGPGATVPRVTLLRNVLKCLYESKCGQVTEATTSSALNRVGFVKCACLNPSTSNSPEFVPNDCKIDDNVIKGPCWAEMRAAAEADTMNELWTHLSNRNTAMGLAFNLLNYCDARYCESQCIPDEVAKAVCLAADNNCTPATGGTGGTGTGGTGVGGTSGSGGTSSNGGTGGADVGGGGTGGTGGTATPVCGNNVVEAGEACEPPRTAECSYNCQRVTDPDCVGGELLNPVCAPLVDACTTSPGTVTTDDQNLCFDVEQCVNVARCGYPNVMHCFCGDVASGDCATAPETGDGSPNGVCVQQIKAGMGPGATNADVIARFTDPNYPGGAALQRLTCQAKVAQDLGIQLYCGGH